MEVGGREAAKILGLTFTVMDAAQNPDLARKHKVFFPAIIVCGDLKIVYPGSGAQLAESIQISGPLDGSSSISSCQKSIPIASRVLAPTT